MHCKVIYNENGKIFIVCRTIILLTTIYIVSLNVVFENKNYYTIKVNLLYNFKLK